MPSLETTWPASVLRTRTPAGRVVQIVLPTLILLGLGIWFNVLYAGRMREPDSLPGLLIPWLVQEAMFLLVATACVWQIGKQTSQPQRWLDLVALWQMTAMFHLVSGGFAVYNLTVAEAGERLADIPTVISLFANSGGTFFGAVINQTAIDEVLHLGLFGAIVGKRFGWRAWWWLSILLFIPYLLTVAGFEWFYHLIGG